MRLCNLKVTNNPVLGTFEISFQDIYQKPYDTIILAGENGSGKSTLMEIIATCASMSREKKPGNETHEYEVEFSSNFELEAYKDFVLKKGASISNYKVTIHKTFAEGDGWKFFKISAIDMNGHRLEYNAPDFSNAMAPFFRSLHSDVAINFNSDAISSVQSNELDTVPRNKEKSTKELATEITQLLIDISALDDRDTSVWVSEHRSPPVPVPDAMIQTRMKRFSKAFEYMFPAKKFFRIENVKAQKQVLFKEGDAVIPLSNFSSGEKQIVFRGSFFLKTKIRNDGAIALVDEPEISLHPQWQLKILNYYKKLLTDESGNQVSQLFVATHSPFIIHNENRYNDKVIILERETEKNLVVKDTSLEFFGWNTGEKISNAFKVELIKVDTNTVFVEGELDEKYFHRTIQLYDRKLNFEIKCMGQKLKKGSDGAGDSALNKAKIAFSNLPDMINGKVVLLYDSDCNKQDEDLEKLFVRSAPKMQNNPDFFKGIESLLYYPKSFDIKPFQNDRGFKQDGKGGGAQRVEADKTRLCNALIAHKEAKDVLKCLNDVLTGLEKLFKQ